ncbi:MAG: DNA ligase [Desulfuromonas sp.]|nr:MAG: DNA ligase [Desulfuromonas sp.]
MKQFRVVVRLLIGLLLMAGVTCQAVMATEPMLPQVYDEQVDVSGWLMSEKLDGVRGYWDGWHLYSKTGGRLYPPEDFTRDLPPFPLEGELWGGRDTFEQTVSTVSQLLPHEGWLALRFAIFDVPAAPGGFTARIERASNWFSAHPSRYAYVIPQTEVHNREQLLAELARVEQLGGEGLIVRRPDALYTAGRSPDILKVKSYEDAEAVVVAHLPGSGRNEGRLGSLLVELADGTRFKLGSGLSDAERDNPPPIGSIITYKYYGYYQSGIPKFPSYLRVRGDASL